LLLSREAKRPGPDLDLSPPMRLDLWAILAASGIAVGTVAPPLALVLIVACLIVAIGALSWQGLVPAEWRLMAVMAPLFASAGAAIALLHAATPDPLAELAAMEPGEVVLIGKIASPPEESGFGYMADLRVERLWYQGREILRGGGVEVFAGDLSIGVGDRVRVGGEISRPQIGEDGFDYGRYLGTNSDLLRATLSPKIPRTSRLLSGRTDTSRRSNL
jgi:competence protein ComEC